ncbi:hypothetical protein D0Z08_08010 [Nocardioides immobilis]|uniref:Uncharacterized protein n=1 Tax=Nocardioides immobilis TaxID=2049295 RepID=A0A417Y535_9ACTN|nr:hypothetical protein [Nocardioides immobilis]RHW27614.1 hypothetical protein D0Z08_08010 [Nocardioides immobilis]
MSTFSPAWRGIVDDAAIFPPGDLPLSEAVAAHLVRREEWYADLVGPLVVKDVDVPKVDAPIAVSVVLTGGAGAVHGAAKICGASPTSLSALEIALADHDDLPGNARRVVAAVDAARAEGVLDDEVAIYVELPHVAATGSWLAAADVVAENELRLKFRTGGLTADAFPLAHALARWIDAALDRETPFKCTAGLHHAVRHTSDTGFEHHGFLNVLVATRLLFDGTPVDQAVDVLEERDGGALVAQAAELDLAGARRWFTSYGSCSIVEPLADLVALGLLDDAS